jgi:hypothetical protein
MKGRMEPRRALLFGGGVAALLAIAVPAIAADPAQQTNRPPRQEVIDRKNGLGEHTTSERGRPDKGAEIARTVTGTIEQTSDDKGRPTFTVTVDGVTWELSAGPKWFHGDNHPLKAWVGKSVEITGTYREGETELDVETLDGDPIRAPGKPPWAGGPKAVGDAHPGWKDWMADGKPGNGHGRENAPGQLKDKTDSDE